MDDATLVQMWDSHKTLFALIKRQQTQIEFLLRSQSGLLDALRKALGLAGDGESAPTATDPEAIARAEAGVAELERMFGTEGKQPDA